MREGREVRGQKEEKSKPAFFNPRVKHPMRELMLARIPQRLKLNLTQATNVGAKAPPKDKRRLGWSGRVNYFTPAPAGPGLRWCHQPTDLGTL